MRNKITKPAVQKVIETLLGIIEDWVAGHMLTHKLKFSFYIVFLLVIFVILWQKMVTNMKMDIIKALGILNILPTTHLATHPDFIKEMNISSLIN